MLTDSLDKAETAAASVHLLESELEEKSATVHDLKAVNQSMQRANQVTLGH